MASPAADIDRLRRKVERGWAAMDGKSDDLPSSQSAFDDNEEDEGSEVEKLSKQLNMQTDMNNDLLQQVIQLETEQQNVQREMQDKQLLLRKTLQVCEQAKFDLQDLKRKNEQVTEQFTRLQTEATEAKVESGLKQRELEQIQQQLIKASQENRDLERQVEEVKRDADRARKEQDQWRNELVSLKEEEMVRDAERRADVDVGQREVQQMKSRIGPLEAELRAEKQRVVELSTALQERTEEWKQSQSQLADTKAKFQHFKQQADRALGSEADLQEQVELKTKQCMHLEQQVAGAGELVAAAEHELREVKKQNQEAIAMKRELEQEVKDMALEMDALAGDLKTQALGRRQDRERLEQRVGQLQQELDSATHDARAIGKSLTEDAGKREQEHTEQRRQLEDTKTKLQNEVARLHDALLGVQRELANVREEMQNERVGYEDRIADSTRKQRAMEQVLARSDLLVAEEANRWREKLLESTGQINARTRLHLETLSALEHAMQSTAQECSRLEANEDQLVDEIAHLRAALRDYMERGNEPLQQWSSESKRSMLQLADLCEGAEHEARDARTRQVEAESQLEAEKNRTLVLEEERTRLEDEIKLLEDRLRNTDTSQTDKVKQLKAEMDNAVRARLDLEQSARRTQDQLDRANNQARTMQEDLERARMQAVEAQTKLRDRVASLEGKLAANEALVNQATAERDQAGAELSISRKKLDAQVQEIAALQRDIGALEESTRGLGQKESREAADLQKQLASCKDNMRKQSTQLANTTKLLQVLQEQKRQWTEEKQTLKLELEEERQKHPLQIGDE
ncbi:hypothetical protein BASA81_008913 [Batrachochytrium salamandrivorans]|nr:hypothetical protein BASA81_008913 [Batrachochytrium salamandrivorans]